MGSNQNPRCIKCGQESKTFYHTQMGYFCPECYKKEKIAQQVGKLTTSELYPLRPSFNLPPDTTGHW